jgi:2-(1,2-epoxy-1,2-dihydrophenyl)acetyl-CoA isomerase
VSTNDTVRVDIDGPIATITLNRPQQLNALNREMIFGMREAALQLASDSRIRVVALTGAGNHFMAGGDVAWFAREKNSVAQMFHEMGGAFHDSVKLFKTMPKPVVAVVQGACAGGGFSLMLATDLAIAADTAMFTVAYTNIGVSPDGGSTFSLPRIVGTRKAMELTLLPDRFDAPTAKAQNLVNFVVPAATLASESRRLLERLAAGPTRAFTHAKRLLNQSFDTGLAEQLAQEVKGFADCASGHDFKEGVTAFVEKRKPIFRGD